MTWPQKKIELLGNIGTKVVCFLTIAPWWM